ncbi:TetR/AcrR family transcriptional regulator [Spirillospora sp. CA-255316]
MTSPARTFVGGRRAEADRNDQYVFAAARQVFIERGPDASMAAVAARAGVGIGTLYRRYPTKTDLVRAICTAAMERSCAEAQAALDEEPDGWSALARFMRSGVALGTGGLNPLAGTFTVTEEMLETSRRERAAIEAIVDRAHREGSLRDDITAPDITLLLNQLHALRGIDEQEAVTALQERYVALHLEGLRAPATTPLPGPAPSWDAIERQWRNEPR